MLRNRLLVAVLLIALVVVAVNAGGIFFFALVAAFALLSGWEFFRLMRSGGHPPLVAAGFVLIAIFLIQAYAHTDWTRDALVGAIGITMIAGVFRRSEQWLVGWGLTFAGALYVGGLSACFILLRDLPDGKVWIAMAAFTTFAMDAAAYTVGVRWGKRPFFPSVSPKKTWEGAIAGWVFAVIAMQLLTWIYSHTNPQMNFWHGLALGSGVGLVGTFGDLAESVIKRQVGAKDSSAMLGAHGGILDRIDSLLFVAPFVYYYAKIILGM